jgi:FeS assembly protein IscX
MEAHPGVDPLTVRFTDLLQWISELPDFVDEIHLSNEKKLEAIQMEWYEFWKDAR